MMLFEARCVGCDRVGAVMCARCGAELTPVGDVVPCPTGVDRCLALFCYEGVGRDLVRAVKYHRRQSLLRRFAPALGVLAAEAGVVGASTVVTWIPTTPARRRERGYDQARLLANGVGRHLGRAVRPVFVRHGTCPQTGSSAIGRRSAPSRQLRLRSPRPPSSILLVDDVVTTGGTIAAAARLLRAQGVERVDAVVLARTPAPGERQWGSPSRLVAQTVDRAVRGREGPQGGCRDGR